MRWFWYFIIYSFLGFLLEVGYARLTHAGQQNRKCFVLLPLCPVYGLGALAILAVSVPLGRDPVWLALAGGVAAVSVEYAVGWFYQRVLGVSFWDYSHLPLNFGGRICLFFAFAWSFLALVLVYGIHPWIARLTGGIPAVLCPAVAVILLLDGAASIWLLKRTGQTEILKWYAHSERAGKWKK